MFKIKTRSFTYMIENFLQFDNHITLLKYWLINHEVLESIPLFSKNNFFALECKNIWHLLPQNPQLCIFYRSRPKIFVCHQLFQVLLGQSLKVYVAQFVGYLIELLNLYCIATSILSLFWTWRSFWLHFTHAAVKNCQICFVRLNCRNAAFTIWKFQGNLDSILKF